MGEKAIFLCQGLQAYGNKRRSRRDESIHKDSTAGRRRPKYRTSHHGDLAAAEFRQHFKRLTDGTTRGGTLEDGELMRQTGVIVAADGLRFL